LKQRIQSEYGIPCYTPANGETLTIQTFPTVPLELSTTILKLANSNNSLPPTKSTTPLTEVCLYPSANTIGGEMPVDGFLTIDEGQSVKFFHHSEAAQALGGVPEHTLKFDTTRPLRQPISSFDTIREALLRCVWPLAGDLLR